MNLAIEIKPSFVTAITQRVKLLQKLGRCEEARADTALTQQLLAEEVQKAGGAETKAGKKAQKKLIAAQRDHTAVESCAQALVAGKAAIGHGHWAQCVSQLDRALEKATLVPALYVQRAECHMRLGRLHEASADAAKALKIEKGHLPALLIRARAFYRLDEKDMALRHIRQLLHGDPEHKDGKALFRTMKKAKKLVARAEGHIQSGAHVEAAAALLSAANVDPTHTLVKKGLLSRRCEVLVQGKLNDEALTACDEALAVDGASRLLPSPHSCVFPTAVRVLNPSLPPPSPPRSFDAGSACHGVRGAEEP